MNPNNSDQFFDEDILRSKAEILRLKGLVPPFGRPAKLVFPFPEILTGNSESRIESTPPPESTKTDGQASNETLASTISASDQLYDELQKIRPNPQIENVAESDTAEAQIDRPSDEVDAVGQLGANLATETATDKFAEPGQFEIEPDGENIDDEKEEFQTDDNSAASEEETVESVEAGAQAESDSDPEMPSFDLAQQIMAAQRKISGNRRKGPGSPRFAVNAEELKAAPLRPCKAASEAPMSPQQRVIAEIVARDIRKHYQVSKVR